jgi:hypothetical protein
VERISLFVGTMKEAFSLGVLETMEDLASKSILTKASS